MEIYVKKRRQVKLEKNRTLTYPHSLQFYSQPPLQNVSLQEFEEFAVDRLKDPWTVLLPWKAIEITENFSILGELWKFQILKAVETVGIRHVKGTDEYRESLKNELRKLGTLKAVLKRNIGEIKEDDLEERRKDHISHFILRLAYCRSEDLRRWFITQEVDLFRYRFCEENDDSITEFLQLNNLNYVPISDSERKSILVELGACRSPSSSPADITKYYKVPFTEALDLVRSRRVFLKNGYAYVPHSDLVVIILSVFRSSLSHALAVTSRALPQLEEDNRLLPMLSHLSKRYLGADYGNKKPTAGVITADMIEMLSARSFPLCMQQCHQGLRQTHHLRHWGRMQYGLFLKAIGLSLDEALKFWRAEFTKMMDVDKFDKQYAYNIRHNYGKEGKRVDYTPYSCVKVITTNHPAVGDHHGCPFKHTDADLLRQRLQALRIPKDGQDEIIENVKTYNYQIACARYFELTHSVPRGSVNINHPNQYFEESMKIHSAEKDGATPAKKPVMLVKSQKSGSSQPSQSSQASQNKPDMKLTDDQMSSLFEDMD